MSAAESPPGRAPEPTTVAVPTPVPPRASKPSRSLWSRLKALRRRGVADDAGSLNKRRIAMLQPQSFVSDQFRTLRARLDSLAAQRPIQTLVVTSAVPGDGKTMSAINLAVVSAMGVGRRVLLVDCDLREPKVHEALGVRVGAGLMEVLRGDAPLDDAIVSLDESGLSVLAIRGIPPNPSELLASAAMRELIGKLAERFDTVILDAPPTLGVPDAKIVGELADGILFVVRAGETPRGDVEAALEVHDPDRILGVVLNGTDVEAARYGYRE